MFPIVHIPETIRSGFSPYRDLFCRDQGFDHISRYVTGLLVCPNKTVQGIDDLQVGGEDHRPSRRAMHAAVCEAGWDSAALMPRHREVIAADHRGVGREVISLDWTDAHHDRGPRIGGINRAWDHVERRQSVYQTVITAVMANRTLLDGIEVVVQHPNRGEEERTYVNATVKVSDAQMEAAQERLLEWLHYRQHHFSYTKRTEIALEMVKQLETEGYFPQSAYACDNG